MATYYGYQEREDPTKSMIDWAGITKDITDGIYAESKRREEEKFTLDENYIKQLNELNEYSQGLNPSVNQAMLGYVQNYRNYLLENHKMMKAGVISVNDSKLAKQGAKDSFNNLNNVVKGVNAKLEELQKKGGPLNDDQMDDLARLMEFKDQQLLIDPKSGMASLARRNEDGTVDKNSIVPVGAAYQMFTPYEQKNVNDMVQGEIKGLAQWTESPDAYTSISDLRDNPDYGDWEDKTIDGMMADQRTTASLGASLGLLDTGELVKKNKAGVITYELTDTGRDKVKEALREAIQVRVNREVKKKESIHQRQEGTTGARNAQQLYNDAYALANFDETVMQSIVGETIKTGVGADAKTKVIGDVDRNGDTLVIYDTQGNVIEQITRDPNDLDASAKVMSKLLTVSDPSKRSAMFEQGRKTGYTGVEIKERGSGDYISEIELMPNEENEAMDFLTSNPSFVNSNVTANISSNIDNENKIDLYDKQGNYIGSYKVDQPGMRMQLFDKLKEYGVVFPEKRRPDKFVTSAERFNQLNPPTEQTTESEDKGNASRFNKEV